MIPKFSKAEEAAGMVLTYFKERKCAAIPEPHPASATRNLQEHNCSPAQWNPANSGRQRRRPHRLRRVKPERVRNMPLSASSTVQTRDLKVSYGVCSPLQVEYVTRLFIGLCAKKWHDIFTTRV